jgi:hypothetical protein
MQDLGRIPKTRDGHTYHTEIPEANTTSGFTPRIIPHFQGIAIPLESAKIL